MPNKLKGSQNVVFTRGFLGQTLTAREDGHPRPFFCPLEKVALLPLLKAAGVKIPPIIGSQFQHRPH